MKYLIFIITAVLLFSCSKERVIKVKTINKVTGAPMPHVTIYIIEQYTNNKPNKTVFDGETDSNGDLIIDLKFKNNGKYIIYQAQVENSCWHNEKSVFLEYKENNNVTFEFAPCAQLKLKIDNVNCQGIGDKFVLYRKNQIGSIDGNFAWEHDGCAFWETNGYSNVPMGKKYYRWEVTRSGNTTTYYDTIYLQEGEQKLYEINY